MKTDNPILLQVKCSGNYSRCSARVIYEGSLKSGKEVAIKRFSQIYRLGPFSDPFTNELAANVGCLKHKHLVKLLGWCSEGKELVLVYEHMANGSLDKILHKTAGPNSPTVLTGNTIKKLSLELLLAAYLPA
ncbi:hypothetical protein IFM89_023354 [Coptis chinensis]|uniref:Serine-threonine/tyrosine-protein kinase catalytic domain-containing protein n=1 Tax=Coptis chinensis TaxID=261450 RepID=A0A835LJJ1_9MAGN|nr:hypothetical protein IFM89_023354 [Coptis chinensis]